MQTPRKLQFLILFVICYPVSAENESQSQLPTLHLLTMVPLPETRLFPYHREDWEILSAAELAVDKINRRVDILPGYRLELIPVNTETCNQSLVTEAPVNFVRQYVTGGDLSIVGVVGLVCSTVTQAISPLTGRPEIDLLQISAGAISPLFASEKEYPLLYRMISSSAVYNDVVLSLMATFQWRRISMVRDATLIQHTSTADNFVAKLDERTELELVFLGDTTPTCPTSPVHNLILRRARIIYASVTASEARELLCEMYQKGYRWPDFVWLFHDFSIEDLILSAEKCYKDTMQTAVEGVFLLRYRLQANPNTVLVSGQTYSEYLMELHNCTSSMQVNQHANSLHDSIWAFALALNNSVSEELRLHNHNMTTFVEKGLKSVHFSGSRGHIAFNEEREVVTEVEIFHVRNGEEICVGHYTQATKNITVRLPSEGIPRDDFVLRLHLAFPISIFVITAILLVFTAVVLIFFICCWNKPSIKATSRYQSLLMLAGCCTMYVAALVVATAEFVRDEFYGPLRQVEIWFTAVGVQLIYSTLFMRLLRIYKIFHSSSNLRKLHGMIWSDQGLAALSFIPVSITIVILVLWSTLYPVSTAYEIYFQEMSNSARLVRICNDTTAAFVWIAVIIYGVNGIPIIAVGILATLTRKVEINIFKDSKEVNMLVFLTVVCLCLWFLFSLMFNNYIPLPQAVFCFRVFPNLVIPFLCKASLFIPKIWRSRHELYKKEAT